MSKHSRFTRSSTHHGRILLVDDDDDVRLGTRMRLCSGGFEIEEANNGRACVEQASQTLPDAILMDLKMPEMDGVEAMERLQRSRETKSIPVVVMSACTGGRQAALDAGARFFIAKPYRWIMLFEMLNAAIDESLAEKATMPCKENQS